MRGQPHSPHEDQELATARTAAATKPTVSRADRFGAGLAALAAFVEREGHVRVPRAHKEGGVSLGSWLNNQKASRDKLAEEQLGQLGHSSAPGKPHDADQQKRHRHDAENRTRMTPDRPLPPLTRHQPTR